MDVERHASHASSGGARIHLDHVYYNIEFLHQNYFRAPSPQLYMPVMILATVPTVTMALFFTGRGRAGRRLRCARVTGWVRARARSRGRAAPTSRRADGEADLLFALSFFAAIFPWFSLPKTPIFGGTKHWLTAYPFLCLFAGYALRSRERTR